MSSPEPNKAALNETFGETLSRLRATYSQTAYRQICYSPIYFSKEEFFEAIAELEHHGLTGQRLSPLQAIAARLLLEGSSS